MGPRTETLTIRLSKEEMADLDHIAKALDCSKAWVLREGLKGQNSLLADLRLAQARLVDGASETHKMVLARNLLNEGTDFWSWD